MQVRSISKQKCTLKPLETVDSTQKLCCHCNTIGSVVTADQLKMTWFPYVVIKWISPWTVFFTVHVEQPSYAPLTRAVAASSSLRWLPHKSRYFTTVSGYDLEMSHNFLQLNPPRSGHRYNPSKYTFVNEHSWKCNWFFLFFYTHELIQALQFLLLECCENLSWVHFLGWMIEPQQGLSALLSLPRLLFHIHGNRLNMRLNYFYL